jgi:CheY-like chemotaxis protein
MENKSPLTAMLVDDSKEDLYIAEWVIKKAAPEFRVISFQQPDAALSHLKQLHELNQPLPDAILLDLNMPVMNGFEFLESSQKLIINHPPVFILTSSSDEGDKLRCSKFKVVRDFLTKPLVIQTVERIKYYLFG